MAENLWPDKVKFSVQRKLDDLDEDANLIGADDKAFYECVLKVSQEAETVFLSGKRVTTTTACHESNPHSRKRKSQILSAKDSFR